jgi:hypothetical protein
MKFQFRCPVCQQNNYFKEQLPPEGQRIRTTCTRCNTPVSWVASEQTKKDVLATKMAGAVEGQIAVGGKKTTVDDWEPGVAIGDRLDMMDVVVAEAGVVRLNDFSQGDRIKQFEKAGTDVSAGICEGYCLHWIRSALQRKGGTQYGQRLDTAREKKRHERAADAYRKMKNDQSNVMARVKEDQTREFDRQLMEYLKKNRETDIMSLKDGGVEYAYSEEQIPLFNWVKKLREEYWCEVDDRKTKGFYKYNWHQFAKELDEKIKGKRSFSGIFCCKAKDMDVHEGGVASFTEAVCGNKHFKVGCCALFKVGIGKSKHAVAVHYEEENKFVLFDPNIGFFQCAGMGKFKDALNVLIGKSWKILGWELDNRFGYAIFRVGAQAEDGGAAKPELQFTPSVLATAFLNKHPAPVK